MGRHLVRLLAERGAEVTVTSRSREGAERGVQFVKGNAHDISFLKTLLSTRWDAIVDFMVYSTECFSERVGLLLKSAEQYVFLSSSRVYADSESPLIESSPRLLDVIQDAEYLASDEYGLAKARQENLLLSSASSNWTIIRPYITYSEDRLQLGVLEKEGWLYRALQGRTIVFSDDIASSVTTLTYGFDVALGILSLIGTPSARGEIFHITSNNSVLWRDVLDWYLAVFESEMGYRPPVRMVGMKDFLSFHSAKYQIRYDRLFDRKFENRKIGTYLDISGFAETRAGLSMCLRAFLRAQQWGNMNWRSEAAKDRLTRERTPLGEIDGIKQKIKYLKFRYLKGR